MRTSVADINLDDIAGIGTMPEGQVLPLPTEQLPKLRPAREPFTPTQPPDFLWNQPMPSGRIGKPKLRFNNGRYIFPTI